jgi:hypothetical protein
VLFPDPEGPTTATRDPTGIVASKSSSARCSVSYDMPSAAKRSSRVISGTGPRWGASGSVASSITSLMRTNEPIDACTSWLSETSTVTGDSTSPMIDKKATETPVEPPSRISQLPNPEPSRKMVTMRFTDKPNNPPHMVRRRRREQRSLCWRIGGARGRRGQHLDTGITR